MKVREVLVRIQIKDQIWYEVISIEAYYGNTQISTLNCIKDSEVYPRRIGNQGHSLEDGSQHRLHLRSQG